MASFVNFNIYHNNSNFNFLSDYFKSPMSSPIIFQSMQDFSVSVGEYLGLSNYEVENEFPQRITITNSTGVKVYEEKTEIINAHLILTITQNGTVTRTQDLGSVADNVPPTYTINAKTLNLPSDTYTVVYAYYAYGITTGEYVATGYIGVVDNHLPLKKWTITDVIVRACDLIEPLRYGEKPRFRFDGVVYDDTTGNAVSYEVGSQAKKYDKILSPEFAFTKMTFREQMQMVGGFIHGEPRITSFAYDNGKRYYNFSFDEYGGNKLSHIKTLKPYVSAGFSTDINEYCTGLDTSSDNLINQLDWAQGVIVEPFYDGAITMRSENTTMRLQEDNSTIIPTVYPIYQTGGRYKIYVKSIPSVGSGEWDISPYIFEKADYDNLSSYAGTYPFVKAYALYYTQGEKNIKGAFFKSEHAVSSIFSKYALLNIIRAVTGRSDLDLTPKQLMEVSFQVEYLPVYGARVQTSKSVIIGGIPRNLAYNQSANIVEARYYGENLKGVVARLGNVSMTYTYHLAFLSDIPKAGMLYDENYYISAVSVEILPTYIKCTVALSKDFNRLSQYVGINTEKRMWEVSEKQAFKRDSVLREYLKISQTDNTSDNGVFFTSPNIVNQYLFGGLSPVSAVSVYRWKKDGNLANRNNITLPVIASSLGNAMQFTFAFRDNYSAGQKVEYVNAEGSGGVSGYWANYVPYGDYYGRFYYLGFAFRRNTTVVAPQSATNYEQNYPNIQVTSEVGDTTGVVANATSPLNGKFNAVKYRKDSREIPQVTYELTAVTDDKDIIIGSALMRNSRCVNDNGIQGSDLKLYGFTERINTINTKLDLSNAVELTGGQYNPLNITNGNEITISSRSGYVAWAIVTPMSETIINVEDEDGNETTQTIHEGGELVIGANKPLDNGITLHLAIKKDIYE